MSGKGKLGFFLSLFFALLLGTLYFGHSLLDRPLSSSDPVVKVVVEISRGARPRALLRHLQEQSVVSEPEFLFWAGRALGVWSNMKAGEYEVSSLMTPNEFFRVVTSGISVTYPFQIVEGENIYQLASKLEESKSGSKAEFLRLVKERAFMDELGVDKEATTMEGYLFPETYSFSKNFPLREKITQMVNLFHKEWTEELALGARKFGFSRFQVVTLASIIEKETGAPSERRRISSVFHNRMARSMRLQSDPTTIYGMWSRYTGNIKKADLLERNAYNTYAFEGLPVGPISNPGLDSLLAAVNPEETPYLYFVSTNGGEHQFSVTYQDHLRAVREFQLDPRARKDKSWRDLKSTKKSAKR